MDINNMLVLDSERNIDVDASVTKFRNAVTIAAAAHKNDLEVIAQGVSEVYDLHRGTYIQIDALKSLVLSKLAVHPSAYGAIADRLHKYVQQNTEAGNGITEDGKPALFVLRKGKGGGFARRADLAPVVKA